MNLSIFDPLFSLPRLVPATAALGLVAFLSGIQPARATVEDINWSVVQNQPITQYFPNEFDLRHPKQLKFEGTIKNPTDIDGSVVMFFDWFDPRDPDTFFRTDSVTIPVASGEENFVGITETLPFCPPQVSLHARVADTELVEIVGSFSHECLVPEPATAAGGVIGLLALLGTTRRRRAARAPLSATSDRTI